MRVMIAILLALELAGALSIAHAHDSWISHGGHRNTAGEWCCGEGDCSALPSEHVRVTPDGYLLDDGELVPFAEAQPSPDGAYWRCRRADGTRRRFFAPPPNS